MNKDIPSRRPKFLSILSLLFLAGALVAGGFALKAVALRPAAMATIEVPVPSALDSLMAGLAGSSFFMWGLIVILAVLIAKEFWHKKGFTLAINAFSFAVLCWAALYWSWLVMRPF